MAVNFNLNLRDDVQNPTQVVKYELHLIPGHKSSIKRSLKRQTNLGNAMIRSALPTTFDNECVAWTISSN